MEWLGTDVDYHYPAYLLDLRTPPPLFVGNPPPPPEKKHGKVCAVSQ
jgi:hypothetical protein